MAGSQRGGEDDELDPLVRRGRHGRRAGRGRQEITVSCAKGEEGFVYRGRLPVRIERTNLADVVRPRTRMMMNVGSLNPDSQLTTMLAIVDLEKRLARSAPQIVAT